MKIGVLQTGLVADELVNRFGEYDRVFGVLMRRVDPEIEIQGWRVVEGEMPARPDEADGWIISGSKHGVYEDHDWLPPLKDFIRACAKARAPIIGVCFGHQVMAEALGGHAEKSEKGWGLGPHHYDFADIPAWMSRTPERITIHAIHQDQVMALAPDATRLASSPFCENAVLLYGAPEAPYAISLQPHPEFTDAFARDLMHARRGHAFPEAETDAALSRLGAPLNDDWAAGWFLDFLRMPKTAAD